MATIRELRALSKDDLIERHDRLARNTQVGTGHYLQELYRRDQLDLKGYACVHPSDKGDDCDHYRGDDHQRCTVRIFFVRLSRCARGGADGLESYTPGAPKWQRRGSRGAAQSPSGMVC